VVPLRFPFLIFPCLCPVQPNLRFFFFLAFPPFSPPILLAVIVFLAVPPKKQQFGLLFPQNLTAMILFLERYFLTGVPIPFCSDDSSIPDSRHYFMRFVCTLGFFFPPAVLFQHTRTFFSPRSRPSFCFPSVLADVDIFPSTFFSQFFLPDLCRG